MTREIVVIEKGDATRRLLEEQIGSKQYHFSNVSTATEAIDQALDGVYELMVIDMPSPAIGVAILNRIYDHGLPLTVIIFAETFDDEAWMFGAEYAQKPNMAALINEIKKRFEG